MCCAQPHERSLVRPRMCCRQQLKVPFCMNIGAAVGRPTSAKRSNASPRGYINMCWTAFFRRRQCSFHKNGFSCDSTFQGSPSCVGNNQDMTGRFRILAQARSQFQLDVLEALLIKPIRARLFLSSCGQGAHCAPF